MDNERALCLSLCETPSDETTWAALADLLEETGRGDQAALLQVHRRIPHLEFGRALWVAQREYDGLLSRGVPWYAVYRDNPLGMRFSLVPRGEYFAGSTGVKLGRDRVVVERDFFAGVYPVTQSEWRAVLGESPSAFRRDGPAADRVADVSDDDLDRFPVTDVNWLDCRRFANELERRHPVPGWEYRLPTEPEWEYACRGAPASPARCKFDYYLATPTNTLTPDAARFGRRDGRPCPVGSYPPNPLGLYDMHGNVEEWCDDGDVMQCWRAGLRGGGWNEYGPTATTQETDSPTSTNHTYGLRLVLVPAGWSCGGSSWREESRPEPEDE